MQAKDNTTYALISGEVVGQLFTKEDMPEWNEEHIQAIELSEEQKEWVEVGMRFDTTTQSIIKPTLEEFKRQQIEHINYMFEKERVQVIGEFIPDDEQLSWSVQTSEAKSYKQSKDTKDCPMLATLAQLRGIELDSLADKVLEKNTSYCENIAKLIGNRQALQDRIESCQSLEEIMAIEYVSPFAKE